MDNNSNENVPISRTLLFNIWRTGHTLAVKNSAVVSFVMNELNIDVESENESLGNLKKQIKSFTSKLNAKWQQANRTLATFELRYSEWLNGSESFPIQNIPQPGPSTLIEPQPSSSKGRKTFKDLGVVSKRRKVKPLVENYSQDMLLFATQSSLRKTGQRDSAKLIGDITANSSEKATEIKRALKTPPKQPLKYTPEEALALYIDGKFTNHSYKLMYSGAKSRHANIYPRYDIILNAKKACYPEEESIKITETTATVKLQAFADHTISRLAKLIVSLETFGSNFTLIHKWGCNGSSGHSMYKQGFVESTEISQTDAFLFSVCLVPLQLIASQSNKIVWQNPRPSSTRFCRPIRILFQKETSDLTKKIVTEIENEIREMIPTNILCNEKNIVIDHSFKLTMINGKTFSAITNSSSQSCGIFGATPKNMNNLEQLKTLQKESAYEYGISSLHAWIRCLECLLHIAYRLDIKKWQIREEADKKKFEERKHIIQNNLKSQLGLLVDIVKPGHGTTNDGNTASRFFENYEITANITGLDVNLVKRLKIILQTISCGYAVNVVKFQKYSLDTANLYVNLYPWFYMPSTLHKILIHGADIIQSAILPIGIFSEEALEARNKDLRRYREFNTRKFSRVQNMTDLFHTLLYSSDPYVTNLSKTNSITRSHNTRNLEKEVLELLVEPQNLDEYCDSSSDSEDNTN